MCRNIGVTGAVVLLGVLVTLSGCSNLIGIGDGQSYRVKEKPQVDLVEVNYEAVDQLLKTSRETLPAEARILTATFVDLDDFTVTTRLGRLLGVSSSARLTQSNYNVINMRIRGDSVAIVPGDGEFLLSREAKRLSMDFAADAVLVGTYTRTHTQNVTSVTRKLERADPELNPPRRRDFQMVQDMVYVSLRLVRVRDNSVIAAHDYAVTADEGIQSLLGETSDEALR